MHIFCCVMGSYIKFGERILLFVYRYLSEGREFLRVLSKQGSTQSWVINYKYCINVILTCRNGYQTIQSWSGLSSLNTSSEFSLQVGPPHMNLINFTQFLPSNAVKLQRKNRTPI